MRRIDHDKGNKGFSWNTPGNLLGYGISRWSQLPGYMFDNRTGVRLIRKEITNA